jgi:hypothetical protein
LALVQPSVSPVVCASALGLPDQAEPIIGLKLPLREFFFVFIALHQPIQR